MVARRLLLPLSEWCVVSTAGPKLLRLLNRSGKGPESRPIGYWEGLELAENLRSVRAGYTWHYREPAV